MGMIKRIVSDIDEIDLDKVPEGDYTLSYSYNNENGCRDSILQTILIYPLIETPDAAFSDTIISVEDRFLSKRHSHIYRSIFYSKETGNLVEYLNGMVKMLP